MSPETSKMVALPSRRAEISTLNPLRAPPGGTRRNCERRSLATCGSVGFYRMHRWTLIPEPHCRMITNRYDPMPFTCARFPAFSGRHEGTIPRTRPDRANRGVGSAHDSVCQARSVWPVGCDDRQRRTCLQLPLPAATADSGQHQHLIGIREAGHARSVAGIWKIR